MPNETTTEEHTHVWSYRDDEYNGLSGGGDYEVWECECGKRKYVELPD